MSITGQGIFLATFTCRNGIGSISVPGLKAGDRVFSSTITNSGVEYYQAPGAVFEIVVSVDDEIQQKDSGDLTASTGRVVVLRQA